MKKIMFNDRYGLTAAVLQGCKTMTRRVIPEKIVNHFEKQYGEVDVKHNKEYQTFTFFNCSAGSKPEDHLWVPCRILEPLKAAPYKIGEEIAVAQCYEDIWKQMVNGEAHANQCYKFYREHQSSAGWNNKMFVRADIMPHQIKITYIKVEQLQDITDWECLAEGIYIDESSPSCYYPFYTFKNSFVQRTPLGWDNAIDAFAALIDKVSGKGTWENNPYCFCYEFKLVK